MTQAARPNGRLMRRAVPRRADLAAAAGDEGDRHDRPAAHPRQRDDAGADLAAGVRAGNRRSCATVRPSIERRLHGAEAGDGALLVHARRIGGAGAADDAAAELDQDARR